MLISFLITPNCFKLALITSLGAPLYCMLSEFADKKFSFVMTNVLLPMALDYHVRSRDNEVNEVATEELNNLNGDANEFSTSLQVRLGRLLKIRTIISEHKFRNIIIPEIGHFTVVYSVTRPMNGSEAAGDLVLIQIFLSCKSCCCDANYNPGQILLQHPLPPTHCWLSIVLV